MVAGAKGRSLPQSDWPAVDRTLREALLRAGTLVEEGGRGRNWAAPTRRRYEQGYGRWLQHCLDRGCLEARSPYDRVTPASITTYIACLEAEGLAPHSVRGYIEALRNVLLADGPKRDIWWLTRMVNHLKARAVPVRPPPPPTSIGRIWGAALEALDALDRRPPADPVKAAIAYRDTLMMALLAFTVVRIKNLKDLDPTRHLQTATSATWLVVPAEEVKNRRAVERRLPDRLAGHLQTYRTVHRPVLLGGRESDRLWISYQGTPLHDESVRKAIKRTTRRLVGVEILPHGFRSIAVTSLAEEMPEEIDLTPLLLEHASAKTTERFYNRATSVMSARRLAAAYETLRAQLGPAPRPRGRPPRVH